MSICRVFFCVGAALFFCAGIGVTAIPNPTTWGLFCVAIGLAISPK